MDFELNNDNDMAPIHTDQLVRFLKSHGGRDLNALDRIKHVYRPRICPLEVLLNLVPKYQSVVDIGCGIGTFLQLVAEYRKPLLLAGIETLPSAINTARSLFQEFSPETSIRLETYDGLRLPDWIREYDYVLLVDVLHHIPRSRHSTFLEQLYDQMKSGSTLILKDIDADQHFWCLLNKIHDLVLARQFTHERGAVHLQAMLERTGYQIRQVVKQRVYVYPHFTIVCEKPLTV